MCRVRPCKGPSRETHQSRRIREYGAVGIYPGAPPVSASAHPSLTHCAPKLVAPAARPEPSNQPAAEPPPFSRRAMSPHQSTIPQVTRTRSPAASLSRVPGSLPWVGCGTLQIPCQPTLSAPCPSTHPQIMLQPPPRWPRAHVSPKQRHETGAKWVAAEGFRELR